VLVSVMGYSGLLNKNKVLKILTEVVITNLFSTLNYSLI